MTSDYDCLECQYRFAIELTELEARSSLEARTDACPRCSRRVGTGPAPCRSCGAQLDLAYPHWHVHCLVASGTCPRCGARHQSLCVC